MRALTLAIYVFWSAVSLAQASVYDTICTRQLGFFIGIRVAETTDSLTLRQANDSLVTLGKASLTTCSKTQLQLIRLQLSALYETNKADGLSDALKETYDSLGMHPVEFTGLVKLPGLPRRALQQRAQEYMRSLYGKVDNVYESGEAMEIYADDLQIPFANADESNIANGSKGHIKFNLRIAVKDGRYRFSFFNFCHYPATASVYGFKYRSLGTIYPTLLNRKQSRLDYDYFADLHRFALKTINTYAKQYTALLKQMMAKPTFGQEEW
jgi:hypothetical protein